MWTERAKSVITRKFDQARLTGWWIYFVKQNRYLKNLKNKISLNFCRKYKILFFLIFKYAYKTFTRKVNKKVNYRLIILQQISNISFNYPEFPCSLFKNMSTDFSLVMCCSLYFINQFFMFLIFEIWFLNNLKKSFFCSKFELQTLRTEMKIFQNKC